MISLIYTWTYVAFNPTAKPKIILPININSTCYIKVSPTPIIVKISMNIKILFLLYFPTKPDIKGVIAAPFFFRKILSN